MSKRPKPLTVEARTDAGKLVIAANVRKQMAAAVKGWPDLPVEIEVRPFEETRRGRQNRFLWAVIYGLLVTGAHYCDFVSFCPQFPEHQQVFIVRVPRDEKQLVSYDLMLTGFLSEVEAEAAAIRALKVA